MEPTTQTDTRLSFDAENLARAISIMRETHYKFCANHESNACPYYKDFIGIVNRLVDTTIYNVIK